MTATSLAVIAVVAPVAARSAAAAALPTVWVLSTGGTIAGAGSSPTDLSNKAGTRQGQALVDAVPQIRQIADVKVEQVANIVSSDITPDLWLKLARGSIGSWLTILRSRASS